MLLLKQIIIKTNQSLLLFTYFVTFKKFNYYKKIENYKRKIYLFFNFLDLFIS